MYTPKSVYQCSHGQIDECVEYLENLASDFEQAAAIIRSQLPRRNRIWIKGLHRRKFGHDISDFVWDIRHLQATGQTRGTTWGRGGGKGQRRRAQNTMGYTHTEREREGQPTRSAGNNCTIVSVSVISLVALICRYNTFKLKSVYKYTHMLS